MKRLLVLAYASANNSMGLRHNMYHSCKSISNNYKDISNNYKDISNNFYPKHYLNYDKVRELTTNFNDTDIYTGRKSQKKSIEHIWPQSFYIKSKNKIKKDMHLVNQVDLETNIFRSNYKYIDAKLLKYNSIRKNTVCMKKNKSLRRNVEDKLFYLPNRAQGIVSRSIAYSLLIYPELIENLDYVIDKDNLISWCINNEITEEEIDRNQFIKEYQGNENPFILNPELILIYKNI